MRITITIIINHVLWWQIHSLADSAGDVLRRSASQSAVLGLRIGFTTYHRPPTIDTTGEGQSWFETRMGVALKSTNAVRGFARPCWGR